MSYLPYLRLSFPGDAVNEYRLRDSQIEFRNGNGTWRVLAKEDVQLHFVLHTEVAKWLEEKGGNAGRIGVGA
jgi:hypothetical protein